MVAHGVRRKRSYASDWLAGWARAYRTDSLRRESAVRAVSSCSECLGLRVRNRLALRRTLPRLLFDRVPRSLTAETGLTVLPCLALRRPSGLYSYTTSQQRQIGTRGSGKSIRQTPLPRYAVRGHLWCLRLQEPPPGCLPLPKEKEKRKNYSCFTRVTSACVCCLPRMAVVR